MRSEPSETRVAVSVAGTEVASVLPSKTIVGLAAVVAKADVGTAVRPAIASRTVKTTAVVLFDSVKIIELRTVDMAFSSVVRSVFLDLTLGL
jgi:hypothetical protein